jgi:PAS domain S-box-containing protein
MSPADPSAPSRDASASGGGLPAAGAPQQVLYVESLPTQVALTLHHFSQHAPHVRLEVVGSGAEALERLAAPQAYDAMLIDLRMPDLTGLDFVREAQRRRLHLPPFIVISGSGDEEAALATLQLGAADCVTRREGYLVQLSARLAQAIAQGRLNRVNDQLRTELARRKEVEETLRVHQVELELQNEEMRRVQVELDASRGRYFDLYDLAPMGYLTLSEQGLILQANLTAATLLGTPRGALVRQPISRFVVPDDQDAFYLQRKRLLDNGEPQSFELRLLRADGSRFWAHLATTVARNEAGAPVLRLVLNDVSKRHQTEDTLRESMQEFRILAEAMPQIVWITRPDGWNIYFNPQWMDYTGLTLAESLGHGWNKPFHADDQQRACAAWKHATDTAGTYALECRLRRADGAYRWWLIRGVPLRADDGTILRWIGTCTDIHDLKLGEEHLQWSLREKDALLKEVHHRVKNNLQIIHSLLRLEIGRHAQPAIANVLRAMQGRIQSMALLHETLYRAGTFAAVDLGAYLQRLATQAFRAAEVRPGAVRLQLDLAAVQVGMDQAIPCGLIVNELVSNGLEHGFPNGADGEVRVALGQPHDAAELCLCVSDNGVGLPTDFEHKRGHALGLQLVADLAGQIGGRLAIGPGPAAVFSVHFAVEPLPPLGPQP